MSGYMPRWGVKQSKANYKQNSDYSPPNNFGQSPCESSIKAIAPRSPQQW